MKMTFSFFLSIYSRCGAPASWAARHTIVCLDVVYNVRNNVIGHRIFQLCTDFPLKMKGKFIGPKCSTVVSVCKIF